MNESTSENRVALVTGGSRGIGRAIAEHLARSGWDVAFTYSGSTEAANDLSASLEAEDKVCRPYQADVRSYERTQDLIKEITQDIGPIELLVNNAGIKRDKALFGMKPKSWHDVIDTNLGGTFNYSRCVIGSMMKRRSGSIISIVSVSGIVGVPGQTNYSASKAGVIGFTKALAKEVARFGVRVNAIAPGLIETDMTRDMPEKAREQLLAQVPAGRMGTTDQVARLVEFLADDGSSYITGQVVPIDGGLV